jgi:hypothetical protein
MRSSGLSSPRASLLGLPFPHVRELTGAPHAPCDHARARFHLNRTRRRENMDGLWQQDENRAGWQGLASDVAAQS